MPARRKRATTRTRRRKRKFTGHSAIRSSCKSCLHKPAQLKKNPSLHNHRGYCSFKRYHKEYCSRNACGCQPKYPKKPKKYHYAAYQRSGTRKR